ncbi:MAG: DNA-binding response regulator [Clostridiales bacterium]|nr:DNA-binding response regulator [Clostridiales bacterium]
MDEGIKVLICEDESSIRKFININLCINGFTVIEAESGEEALEMIRVHKPMIVVLDVMLPGIDGFEVCQRIRKSRSEIIIIMLTARGQDMDKIMGLGLGADDYMVKPFNPLELVARIKAILRRSNNPNLQSKDRVKFGVLEIDKKSQKFYKDSREIDLTPTEFSIINIFMNNPGKAFSRDELLNAIWGQDYFGDVKTVDVHIRRLREKIEDNPSSPSYIETVWGFGYRWQEESK